MLRYLSTSAAAVSLAFLLGNTGTPEPTPAATIVAAAQSNRSQFCSGLKQYFAQRLPTTWEAGLREQSALRATEVITANLVNDNFSPYLSARELTASSTPRKAAEDRYYPVADAIGAAIGTQRQVIFTDSVADLRFLPFSMQNRDLILATNTAEPLDEQRMKAVVATARRLSIRVNVLWTGELSGDLSAPNQAITMATVAHLTGGQFVAIGQDAHSCYSQL